MFWKRFARLLFTKTFLSVLMLILQVGVLVWLVWQFSQVGVAAYAAITVITVVVVIALTNKDDLNPSYKLIWSLLVLLMPIFGTLFYLLWGHGTIPRGKRLLLRDIEWRTDAALVQDPAVMEALEEQDRALHQNAYYLWKNDFSPVYPAEGCAYYPIGEDFFPPFLEALRGARKYIFLEYYIWEEGYMLDTTIEVLRQKAAEGVEVRVMWDGLGSLFTLPPGYEDRLRAMGIQCRIFCPLEFTLHVTDYAMLNHRDHRKIASIDGEIAFSGGLNLADEYINAKERFGVWKDTAFKVQGEAAWSLTTTFLRNWDYASDAVSDIDALRPPLPDLPAEGPLDMRRGYVQPYWDSPLDNEHVSTNAYLNVIRHATDYVYIATPYLIIDQDLITGLTLAAKSGVDVRIITPGIPDKRPIFAATQSYYPVLLRAGVRIFEYTPGFIHAKMYASDDRVAIVGSANMDFRSLYLHFENCSAFYGGPMVRQVRQDMLDTLAVCREVTLEETSRTPWWRRAFQGVMKVLAPLL